MSSATTSPGAFRVALVQSTLVWHEPEANRAIFEALLAPLQNNADLVVLPEMFPAPSLCVATTVSPLRWAVASVTT